MFTYAPPVKDFLGNFLWVSFKFFVSHWFKFHSFLGLRPEDEGSDLI